MKQSEVLRAAAAVVAKGWCQEQLAKDKDGKVAPVRSDAACQWCLLGALDKSRSDGPDGWTYLNNVTGINPIKWNDAEGRTQGEVVAALVQAAELAESEGE